jgi:hypothetical protein
MAHFCKDRLNGEISEKRLQRFALLRKEAGQDVAALVWGGKGQERNGTALGLV